MKTRTHFAHRVDMLDAAGEIQEHLAGVEGWRVIIMRSRGEYLGSVEAPDREGAEAAAVKQFELDQDL
jgi:hypothetical protein